MVATVLRLRYRILGNTLARRPWQLVGYIFGGLWALSALGGAVVAFVTLALLRDTEAARLVSVIGGSALVLGWTIGPVILAGMDTSVDAGRLAPFPFTRRQVMAALFGVGATGIPGIASTLVALATVVLWIGSPLAAVAAVPAALLGVALCVLASRLVSDLAGGIGGNRRGRELVGTLVLLVIVFAGPIITGILSVLGTSEAGALERLGLAGDVLAWTPLGAAWAVPSEIAAGDGVGALLRLAIAVASLVVLWVVWARVLDAGVSTPRQRSARTVRSGALGLFGFFPTGAVGATWARSLTGWLRDPRYLRQLLIAPLLPIVFAFSGGVDGFLFTASPVFVALVLSIVGYSDVSYDGTAFGTSLATGIRGRDDRLGRLLGAATVTVPLLVLVTAVTAIVSGSIETLPAVLGAGLAILLSGLAVCAVSSAMIVVPVAAPGDSPFKSVPGQNALNGFLVFVVWGIALALALPALVPVIVSMVTGAWWWGWIALAVAVVVGAGAIAAGVVVGGRTLDRNGPDLLTRIKAFPT